MAFRAKKVAVPKGTAKFREETSKKADSSVSDRVAAVHNLAGGYIRCKQFFALHQCFFVGQIQLQKNLACLRRIYLSNVAWAACLAGSSLP